LTRLGLTIPFYRGDDGYMNNFRDSVSTSIGNFALVVCLAAATVVFVSIALTAGWALRFYQSVRPVSEATQITQTRQG
jgi:hypothetical protein